MAGDRVSRKRGDKGTGYWVPETEMLGIMVRRNQGDMGSEGHVVEGAGRQ